MALFKNGQDLAWRRRQEGLYLLRELQGSGIESFAEKGYLSLELSQVDRLTALV